MRKSTSIILAITFIVVSITGIQLLIGHKTDILNFYLVKHIHELVGILFVIAGLVHLKINFKTMLSYIAKKG